MKIIGRVSQEPYLNISKQVIYLDQIKVFTDPFPTLFYGDQVQVFGKLEERLLKSGQKEFSLYTAKIEILDHAEGASWWVKFRRNLILFRNRLDDEFKYILPEPQASLLSGILLGSRKNLSSNFFQKLQRSGTLHLIAASGYNISVVAGVLISLLTFVLSRKIALFWAFIGIGCYVLMAGASPAVIRAAIMGSLAYGAQFIGREKDAIIAFAFSALVMLFIKPLILFDIGFQLSFAATGGILWFLPILEKVRFFRENLVGKEAGLTLAAQIGVLPLVLYHFGSLNVFSLVANGLAGPLVPYVMGFGAILVISGLIPATIAKIIAIPAWVVLTLMVKIINFIGDLPWGDINNDSFPVIIVITYYLVMIGLLWRQRNSTWRS